VVSTAEGLKGAPVELRSCPDARAVALAAADLMADLLQARPDAVILLPAGATPVPLYAELARRSAAGELDPSRARFVQLDELAGVAATDARGFNGFLEQHFAAPMAIGERLLRIDGQAPSPETEIARHAAALQALGTTDLALLGLGPNGHVAFNEPGSEVDVPARVIELAPGTVAGMQAAFPEGAPTRGLTLGLREILAARQVVVLVTGASKSAALARLMSGPPEAAFPASWLGRHPHVTVLADGPACSRM
jgi:glucosamine-6-phosphate deaminase